MNVNITLTFMVFAYITIIYCSINYYFILNTSIVDCYTFFKPNIYCLIKKNIHINWLNQKILNVKINIIKKLLLYK